MKFKILRESLQADFSRFENLKEALGCISFYVLVFFRLTSYARTKCLFVRKLIIPPVFCIFKFCCLLSGIQIKSFCRIGKGLRIYHFGEVVIAGEVEIGDFVTLHQGVTLGRVVDGTNEGVPTIGNHVLIFPGAKVIGGIKIGDYTVIGANSVVTKDIPSHSIVVGIPGKVIGSNKNKKYNDYWKKLYNSSLKI